MRERERERERETLFSFVLSFLFFLSFLLYKVRGEEIGIIFTCLQSAQNVQIYTREREDNNRGKRKE